VHARDNTQAVVATTLTQAKRHIDSRATNAPLVLTGNKTLGQTGVSLALIPMSLEGT
jgi:hypothetical protein